MGRRGVFTGESGGSTALQGRYSGPPGRALKTAGVRPSKSRGQNFLVQPSVATRIVNAADIGPADTVVEIGPGLGILTERILCAGPRKLILVELDGRLAAMLGARFGGDNRIKLIHRDFLMIRPEELGNDRLKIVASLPFSAAAAILRHLCDYRESIVRMILMFQREVGERIRAVPGWRNYGLLKSLLENLCNPWLCISTLNNQHSIFNSQLGFAQKVRGLSTSWRGHQT